MGGDELCVKYAQISEIARGHQGTLQKLKCEFASKEYSPVYSSDFVCIEPGEAGRLACTLMTPEELEKEEDGGACDSCKFMRIPALIALRLCKMELTKLRKQIARYGLG